MLINTTMQIKEDKDIIYNKYIADTDTNTENMDIDDNETKHQVLSKFITIIILLFIIYIIYIIFFKNNPIKKLINEYKKAVPVKENRVQQKTTLELNDNGDFYKTEELLFSSEHASLFIHKKEDGVFVLILKTLDNKENKELNVLKHFSNDVRKYGSSTFYTFDNLQQHYLDQVLDLARQIPIEFAFIVFYANNFTPNSCVELNIWQKELCKVITTKPYEYLKCIPCKNDGCGFVVSNSSLQHYVKDGLSKILKLCVVVLNKNPTAFNGKKISFGEIEVLYDSGFLFICEYDTYNSFYTEVINKIINMKK